MGSRHRTEPGVTLSGTDQEHWRRVRWALLRQSTRCGPGERGLGCVLMARPTYDEALRRAGPLEALAAFDPPVPGTPPLGLDLPASDVDILCHAPDLDAFAAVVGAAFGACDGFFAGRW